MSMFELYFLFCFVPSVIGVLGLVYLNFIGASYKTNVGEFLIFAVGSLIPGFGFIILFAFVSNWMEHNEHVNKRIMKFLNYVPGEKKQ